MLADHFDEHVPSMVVHTFGDSGAVSGAKQEQMAGKIGEGKLERK